MAEQTILDLDAMMDDTLDAIPEAPEFMNPPAGLYRLAVKSAAVDHYMNKEGVYGSRIKMMYSVVNTVQIAETDAPVPDGSMFSETFQATEDGLSYFKAKAKAILNVTDLNGVAIREVFASLAGAEFDAKITIRKSSKNGVDYENAQVRVVPPKAA
jgi:hypothetical protein